MELITVRMLRGKTLTDEHLWDRAKSDQPPTYGIGDIVKVTRLTAQQLVGSLAAEYYSGPPVVEPAEYEEQPEEPETAAVEAPEAAVMPRGRPRKAG